jgi:hypothetical protein
MNLQSNDTPLRRAQLGLVEVLRYTKNFEGRAVIQEDHSKLLL